MKVEEGTTAVPAARRHIIRRPRLTRMLDECGARIILLVAPAGYGKTTLAQQWLEEGDRRGAWYRCTPASADVAALAAGVARTVGGVVPRAGERMLERLNATANPDEDARELAEILGEDLTDWPGSTWLVLDDYHLASSSAATDQFLEALLDASPIRLLATSRRRPSWASARRRTYGEVFELDRTHLALTDMESRAVLGSRADVETLLERAQGWPAVIGMAALSRDDVLRDSLPARLYDYFAEELFDAADPETRWALCQLAIASAIDNGLGTFLLPRSFKLVAEHALRIGIAVGRIDGTMELHPLLRRFLRSKLSDYGQSDVEQAVAKTAHYLLRSEAWDDVFEIVRDFGSLAIFEELVEAALPSLLTAGRVSTVQRWLDFAAEQYFRSPLLDFAEAELSVRQGLYAKAETLALQAAGNNVSAATALSRAGRAAHLDSRPHDAIRHHRAALMRSPSIAVEREALWGLVVGLVEIEDFAAAADALAALDAKTGDSVNDKLRVAGGEYLISVRSGRSAEARPLLGVAALVDRSDDPMARSSFLNSCAIALTTNGRYGEADAMVSRLLAEAEDYRLRFVLPYAELRLASVAAGQRRFAEAFAALERAEAASAGASDKWMSAAAPAIRAMVLMSAGETAQAIVETQVAPEASPSLRAELLAVRSLALACSGDHVSAASVADEARSTSITLEAQSLTQVAQAITACASGKQDAARDACEAAFAFVYERATIDHLVTAYRAFSDILEPLAELKDPRLGRILVDAGDANLAARVGVHAPRRADALGASLSPREREVFDLMASGLTNKQIAQALYISESTTKVHVRHIFEKLGANTRTEAVARGKERLEGT